jgi:hypothetical protein
MVKLSKAVTEIIVHEFGREDLLRRLSDPFFFQSFGCIAGFDWHSSGLTTTLTSALREAINPQELSIAVLGGKGKASRKTPEEIEKLAEIFPLTTKKVEMLKYASKMSAKVDNSALQDGFQLYHHAFIVTEEGKWAVIQQGMNPENRYARRYHWLSEKVSSFVVEPHTAIVCDIRGRTLNMVAKESEEARQTSVDLIKDNPIHLQKYFSNNLFKYLRMPPQHGIELSNYKWLMKSFLTAYEQQPKNYEKLLAIKGIGPKSVRALALLSKLIFGVEASWRDPTTFSFAHGGKDHVPFPIDKHAYDSSIEILENAIKEAKIGNSEKISAIKRLEQFFKM